MDGGESSTVCQLLCMVLQIDMIEMESSEYGDRCYNMALLVTDLYSQYVFGRALSDALDPSLLVRHLMDIFGAFAPPGLSSVVLYLIASYRVSSIKAPAVHKMTE